MLLMFKDGEIADQMIGAAPKARLMDWIKSATA
jgi:thioredoxin 1